MLHRSGAFGRQLLYLRNLFQKWARLNAKSIQSLPIYNNSRHKYLITFASVAGFSFKNHGISEERKKECDYTEEEFKSFKSPGKGWELLYEENDMLAFRRRIEGPYEMYEYKCVGTYYDISPRTFIDAQNDLNYRKEWDDNIVSIDVIQEEDENELICWVSKFPYPLYPREYVYVRRTWVSNDEKYAVIDSEAVSPEVYQSSSKSNVRVSSYSSKMSVRAHSDWESHGVDYILTYSDNPEANIPRYVYNWMVNKGGPYFLRQVHKAALEIESSKRVLRSAMEQALIQKNKRLKEMDSERMKNYMKSTFYQEQEIDRRHHKDDAKRQSSQAKNANGVFLVQNERIS